MKTRVLLVDDHPMSLDEQMLQPGGAAGLFWNAWMLDPAVHDHDGVRRIYAERGSGLRPDVVPFELDDNPPDGMDQVHDWYEETLGTSLEGTAPPAL